MCESDTGVVYSMDIKSYRWGMQENGSRLFYPIWHPLDPLHRSWHECRGNLTHSPSHIELPREIDILVVVRRHCHWVKPEENVIREQSDRPTNASRSTTLFHFYWGSTFIWHVFFIPLQYVIDISHFQYTYFFFYFFLYRIVSCEWV